MKKNETTLYKIISQNMVIDGMMSLLCKLSHIFLNKSYFVYNNIIILVLQSR